MKIQIENYNNIESLSYEIQENKINFLVGISGCGKSSIATALTSNDLSTHAPFGSNKESLVKVNDKKVLYESYELFNIDYMTGVLINKSKESDVYNILISESGELKSLKNDYIISIESLLKQRETIQSLLYKIDKLINELRIKYKKDGNYGSTCSIQKLIKNIDENTNSYVKGKKYDSTRIKWFNDGKKTDEYENSKCPFCNKKLSDSKKNQIEKIIVFDSKTFEIINSKAGLLDELNIKQPNWLNKKEVLEFNKKIKMHYEIKQELDNILQYIYVASKVDISIDSFKLVKPSNTIKELYPSIYECIINFNINYSNIMKQLVKLKKNTDLMIGKNVKVINDMLSALGIQYKFQKMNIDDENKKASYIIKHNLDKLDSDRVNNLSFGEKNIIGLILFLISHKNKKFLIIDDPASSYDEYRRKVIFDILYDFKEENTTMLVLSHDQVFAKYAIYHRDSALEKNERQRSKRDKKYMEFTGNVDYIETYKEAKIIKIARSDFDSMSNFIKARLKELPNEINYITAVNLRLYYEINKSKKYHKDIYGYLSAILHRFPKNEISEKLSEKNRTEQEILDIISKDLQIEYNILSDDYTENVDLKNLNIFEKLIYARENVRTSSNKGKVIKDELSNIIHLNLAYAVCLNPYKFNYFSKYVYDYVTKEINISLQE